MDDFDGIGLLVSLLVSAIGFVFFSYGRKMTRPPQVLCGITLMVFPYFVSGPWVIVLIAVVILAVLRAALYLGW